MFVENYIFNGNNGTKAYKAAYENDNERSSAVRAVTVKDPELVRKDAFTATGSKEVIMNGTGVQVVYGPQVSVIKNEIEEILEQ